MLTIKVSANHRFVQGWQLYYEWHITFYTHFLTFNAEVEGIIMGTSPAEQVF